jgi:hypothetical protein
LHGKRQGYRPQTFGFDLLEQRWQHLQRNRLLVETAPVMKQKNISSG